MLMEEQIRKIKRYDVVVAYLKRQIKLCDSDIKEFEKNKNIYFEQISILKATKEIYQEILTKMEEGKK